jgi:hypothetical protein
MSDDLVSELDAAIRLWVSSGNLEESIFGASNEKIFEFSETLVSITRYHAQSGSTKNENFSFTANSALSGGSHPCASPECRIRRVESLISFATLYADEVYIQQPFEDIAQKEPSKIREVDRHNLASGIYTYFLLRPLIKQGIIKYAHDANPFCNHHYETVAKPLIEDINRKVDRLQAEITKELLECCRVTFNYTNSKSPFFDISGPERILEHGQVFFHAYNPPPNMFKTFKNKGPLYTLSKSEMHESGALDFVIHPILRDITFQEWHTALTNTSYLCDNNAHMALVSKVNNDIFSANSSAFASGLKHYLPRVHSRDANALLALRNKESEAFFVYRDKLRKLLKTAGNWGEREVAAVFRDEVLPEINVINKKLQDWKLNTRQSIGEKVLFGTGAVTLGLYAGLLPANIGQLVAALGGTSAAAAILMDWNKTFKEKQQARSNDFFFLWEAANR